MTDPLALTPEAMRAAGYAAVDLLVERLADPSIPALQRATPIEMAERLAEPPPDRPQEVPDVLARLSEDVLPYMNRADHPRFFAFVPSCQTFPGALGDFIAQRAQRLRRVVDGVGGAEPGRADRARLVQGLARLSGGRRRDPAQRRVGGQHDRARVRARVAARAR